MEKTRGAIVEWVRARKGRAVMAELAREVGISKKCVYRLFKGGWAEVLAEAGRVEGTRVVDAREVVARLAGLERELGRGVTWNELAKGGRRTAPHFHRATLPLEDTAPHFHMATLPYQNEDGDARREPGGAGARGSADCRFLRQSVAQSVQAARETYGRPMVEGAVVCEPVNELGVVCLFGAMAAELGYCVMRVRGEFPDCEALRRREDGRWERVRVEFEFRSGNFARHGHDARGCDVIVCWEDDWEGCPIEVVELKGRVGGGRGIVGRMKVEEEIGCGAGAREH